MGSKAVVSALAISLAFGAGTDPVRAQTLTVTNVTMSPGTTASVEVFGTIAGEAVYVSIELYLSGGTSGTVNFTPAPPTDILQVAIPGPGQGRSRPAISMRRSATSPTTTMEPACRIW